MGNEKYKYWSGASEFINADAKRLLTDMLNYDNNNGKEISIKCHEALNLLDKAIALFISVLQKLYENKSRWESASNSRAAVAMANSALNYHLLARHTVILGYPSETEPLFRACFERMTRCAAFQLDKTLAEKFWAGKEIRQKQIRDILSKYFEDKVEGTNKIAQEIMKDTYKKHSEVSHPNLKTLQFRTLNTPNNTEIRTGIDFSYGSEPSYTVTLLEISNCISHATFSLIMLWILSQAILGTWGNVLERKIQSLFKEDDALLVKILKMQRKDTF